MSLAQGKVRGGGGGGGGLKVYTGSALPLEAQAVLCDGRFDVCAGDQCGALADIAFRVQEAGNKVAGCEHVTWSASKLLLNTGARKSVPAMCLGTSKLPAYPESSTPAVNEGAPSTTPRAERSQLEHSDVLVPSAGRTWAQVLAAQTA